MVARPFDGRELGSNISNLGAALPELTVFGMMLGSGKEIVHFMRATRSVQSAIYVAKRLSKHFLQVVRYGRGMMLTNGNALAGRLAKSAFDLDIPLWLSSPAKELITQNGQVRGAVIQHEGRNVSVTARRGVVLACGGFPHDIARRKALFPHAPSGTEHYSPGPTGNTGDGLRLGESVGGRVDTSLPNAAAWVPVSITTRKDGSKGVMPHFIDRAKPGVIAVTADGKRFTNEGSSYHDFVQAMDGCLRRPRCICLSDLRSSNSKEIWSWSGRAVPPSNQQTSSFGLSRQGIEHPRSCRQDRRRPNAA